MTTLYLIRHGESECNKDRVFTAQYDANLTDTGLMQGKYICSYFENIKIDKIYSSDLNRALDTVSTLLQALGLQVTPNKNFREIDAGKWTKMPFSEIEKRYPKEYELWINDIGRAACPDGESVAQLCDRVSNELETICIENTGKTILVSTHATPIRAFLTKVKTGSIVNMKDMPWVLNASVTKLTYENSTFKVDFENDVTHLNGLLTFLPENI